MYKLFFFFRKKNRTKRDIAGRRRKKYVETKCNYHNDDRENSILVRIDFNRSGRREDGDGGLGPIDYLGMEEKIKKND